MATGLANRELLFFFFNYLILKCQFRVILLGDYLQYLDVGSVVLRSAEGIFIHILAD